MRRGVRQARRCVLDTIARMLETLTAETFAPKVGSTFRIVLDEALTLDAELETVEAAGAGHFEAARVAGQREPFSIVFRGPAEPVLPQQIYRLEHDELGVLELFLVPIAQDEGGTRYEAVFA